MAKIKAIVLGHGDNAYELCEPDSPQEGIRAELPYPLPGLTDIWLITGVGCYEMVRQDLTSEMVWWAGITLEADPMTTDATPLDNLPEPILQQIYSRMLDLEFGDNEIEKTYHFTCPECGYQFEESWTCAADDNCPQCGHRHIQPDGILDGDEFAPLVSKDTHHLLLTVFGDVEPAIEGPFHDNETVFAVAKRYREEHGEEHGLFRLDIDWAKKHASVWPFSYSEFDGSDEG